MNSLSFAKELSQLPDSPIKYSICTLVNNQEEYARMLDSFVAAGFAHNFCEYIYADNSQSNRYDAYAGLNQMLSVAQGTYIILCHQDIELRFDKIDDLEKRIAEVDTLDPTWGILANAGGVHLIKKVVRITDPGGEFNEGPFPCKVQSIDENFMIFKKSANLSFSRDLQGFHLYGTDCCIIANIRGYSAWVIDFHLLHKSSGNFDKTFYQKQYDLLHKYRYALRPRYIRTVSNRLFISGNTFLFWLMNKKPLIFFAKLRLKIIRLVTGNHRSVKKGETTSAG